MKNNWSDTKVAEAWMAANGSTEFPFGDFWRMGLVNPFIMDLVPFVSSFLGNGQTNLAEALANFPIYKGLSSQRSHLEYRSEITEETLIKWHRKSIEKELKRIKEGREKEKDKWKDPYRVSILDIGCQGNRMIFPARTT